MPIEHSDESSRNLKGSKITIGAEAPLAGWASALGGEMLETIRIAVD